ncbi:hypothetical protein F5B19DRAFT_464934 [Rostrohypoxylon terebratum]|nr:hypothetical protein F5B19DRAFT_464934 [Rostrohypoxylon terebratum]
MHHRCVYFALCTLPVTRLHTATYVHPGLRNTTIELKLLHAIAELFFDRTLRVGSLSSLSCSLWRFSSLLRSAPGSSRLYWQSPTKEKKYFGGSDCVGIYRIHVPFFSSIFNIVKSNLIRATVLPRESHTSLGKK